VSAPSSTIIKRVAEIIGAEPERWLRVEGGYTPAARWVIESPRGSAFVKVATTPLSAEALSREIAAYSAIRGNFIPRLVGMSPDIAEPILIIENLSDAIWPPPWTTDLVRKVRIALDALHDTRSDVPQFAAVHAKSDFGWSEVERNPAPFLSLELAGKDWLDRALPALLEAEMACDTSGASLTHWDIRSDNICITNGAVKFIDWGGACLSNPKLDTGFWLPSLAFEGGPLPEDILPDEPGIAAWVSGFFACKAGLPTIPDAPRVRQVQRAQLSTALPWAVRALGLSQPESARSQTFFVRSRICENK